MRSGESRSEVQEHLRIVDDKTFDMVQSMLAVRSKQNQTTRSAPINTRGESLLAGNVFCGHCGARLCITTSGQGRPRKDGTDTRRVRYTCQTKSRTHGDCDGQTGYDLTLETCAEAVGLSQFGISHGHCIDGELLEKIIGQPLSLSKDKNQREECGCMASIDIGMYDSCTNGCKYCYANHSFSAVRKHIQAHDPNSPLLYGNIGTDDTVKDRIVSSCIVQQTSLFRKEDHHVPK